MSARAYEGPVVTGEIRLGAQALLIGPAGTPDPTEKVTDIQTPPTGYRFCGSLKDNRAELRTTKERFQLKTGIPETIKYEEIVAVGGQLTATLNEWSMPNLWDAMGRPTIKNTVGVSAGTIASGTQRGVLKVGSGEVTTMGVAVGDQVVVDEDANLTSSANISEVASINASADTITLSYKLPQIPANGQKVKVVTATKMAYGDTSITKIKAVLVFDAKDGTQILHVIDECAMTGEYAPTMADTKQNIGLPITLEAYGFEDTDFADKTLVCKPIIFHK